MVDILFDGCISHASKTDVESLVELLVSAEVGINTRSRFTIAFNKPSTVEAFVSKWQLLPIQRELLMEAHFRWSGAKLNVHREWVEWRRANIQTMVNFTSQAMIPCSSTGNRSRDGDFDPSARDHISFFPDDPCDRSHWR